MNKHTIELQRLLQRGEPIEKMYEWILKCLDDETFQWRDMSRREQKFWIDTWRAFERWADPDKALLEPPF